jgi:hypothetical protein
MLSWIVTVLAYLFAICFFSFLGGISAASDAIQEWGRTTASRRRRAASVSRS